MLARLIPQTPSKAEGRLFTDRDRFTARRASRETNPTPLLFRPEPT